MSKINRIRIINLNYNNNLSRVDDEIFDFAGKSTLISLRNGGGKSVLIQMIMSLFVHGNYRNIGDRKFKDYFTLPSPTIIMVEWLLDNAVSFVLTGMMVRKRADNTDDLAPLEIYNFIGDYNSMECEYAIDKIGFVEYVSDVKHLKGFVECKKTMETYKKNSSGAFNYYDMNQNSKSYFTRLAEFGIDYREWESIIHKVNEQESGLSDLFKNVKDERGLTEKWFLKSVENKLNEDGNLIESYVGMIERYVKQYRTNQSLIEKRKNILAFNDKSSEINNEINSYQHAYGNEKAFEKKISGLLLKFKEIEREYEEKRKNIENKINLITEDISRTHHEKISCEIYEIMDSYEKLHSLLQNLNKVIANEQTEAEVLEHNIDVIECARLYGNYVDVKKDVMKYKKELEAAIKSEEEKLPEINRLGHEIYLYYANENVKNENAVIVWREKDNANKIAINSYEIAEKECHESIGRYNKDIGIYTEKVNNYIRFEKAYNDEYHEKISRSMTGFYETGFLEKKTNEYGEEYSKLQKNYDDMDGRLVVLGEETRNEEKKRDDCREEIKDTEHERMSAQKAYEEMEKIISRRENLMRYVSVPADFLFNTDYILGEYDKNIKAVELDLSEITRSQEKIKEELYKLLEGRIMELPKEFSDRLERLGIPVTYGMEWLKKNSCTTEKNEKFVAGNPFIPYSIILTRAQIDKLKNADIDLYTSFPIPIVEKEKLEAGESTGKMHDFGRVKFYVWFNKNLLDEEKLNLMKAELSKRLQETERQHEEKTGLFRMYTGYRQELECQDISLEKYSDMKNTIEFLNNKLIKLEEKLRTILSNIEHLENESNDLTQKSKKLRTRLDELKRQQEAFERLKKEYEAYNKNAVELKHLQELLKKTEQELEAAKSSLAVLNREKENIKDTLENLFSEGNNISVKTAKYSGFSDGNEVSGQFAGVPENMDIINAETEFDALTSKLQNDIKELEQGLKKSTDREIQEKNYLSSFAEESGITKAEYENASYSLTAVRSNKEKLAELQASLKEKLKRKSNYEREEASIESKRQSKYEEMKKYFGFDELIPREEVVKKNFDEIIAELERLKKSSGNDLKTIQSKLNNISANITAMSEYENLVPDKQVTFEEDFRTMNDKDIDKFRGVLVRDYKVSIENVSKSKENLKNKIIKVKSQQEFADEYFKIPLNNLLVIADREEPDSIYEQFTRVLEAAKNVLEKLDADLEIFEREKEDILSGIAEYIKKVHDNLACIDKNSSISVRNRPIKMLKINLPEWNNDIVNVRISAFVDKIKDGAMALYDRNENADEYISKNITTVQLYDATIGISNVEINLYKIEEGRETKITWKEGMKNSGGEGFLSAFVVLSSLLCYMRHGRNDLFYEKNEGKVLIMDNPFAQTSSAHLLKPLMEMAEKTNTQLICLSGLGGEAIYGRFDNIYVLNLIPSAMKKGLCFMKSEHRKGDEMVNARVRVED